LPVVVSKKVHKSAVGRNRIRRRVYEILRQHVPHFTGVYDVAADHYLKRSTHHAATMSLRWW